MNQKLFTFMPLVPAGLCIGFVAGNLFTLVSLGACFLAAGLMLQTSLGLAGINQNPTEAKQDLLEQAWVMQTFGVIVMIISILAYMF